MKQRRTRAEQVAWKIEHTLGLLEEVGRLTNEIEVEVRRLSLRLETVEENAR